MVRIQCIMYTGVKPHHERRREDSSQNSLRSHDIDTEGEKTSEQCRCNAKSLTSD